MENTKPQPYKQKSDNEKQTEIVVSFLTVRNFLGLLGAAMPIGMLLSVALWEVEMQTSISAFYHTEFGDIFVGILCAIGIFLLTYKGFEIHQQDRDFGGFFENLNERAVAITAGIAAIGVALFPSSPVACDPAASPGCDVTGFVWHAFLGPYPHYVSAVIFFVCMYLFCRYIFTKGGGSGYIQSDTGKMVRYVAQTRENKIFRRCGWTILISLLLLGIYFALVLKKSKYVEFLDSLYYVFVWETVALFAFAIAWITKGKLLILILSTKFVKNTGIFK